MIPPKVKVCNVTYQIACNPQATALLRDGPDNAANHGHFDSLNAQIIVAHNLPPDALRAAFFHEVVHALSWESGIFDLLGARKEEAVTTMIANGLLLVLRENPSLVTYLVSADAS